MTELGCGLDVRKERRMMLRSLALTPGGPGADFLVWELQASPFFPLVLLIMLQGTSLNTSLWAPLCCVLGIMEFLCHAVGWVFRI